MMPLLPSTVSETKVADAVWFRFAQVNCYIEPFAGGAGVFFGRGTIAGREILNDADGFVSNFYRAAQRDPDAVAKHATWPTIEIDLTSRHRWLKARGIQALAPILMGDPDWFDSCIAGWWFWGLCRWPTDNWCSGRGPRLRAGTQVFQDEHGAACERPVIEHHRGAHARLPKHQGILNGANTGTAAHGSYADRGNDHSELSQGIHQLATRLRNVTILCGDWQRAVTPKLLTANTGIFLDPPYRNSFGNHETDVSRQCRVWAIEHGAAVKIAFCTCPGGDDMPSGWEPYSDALQGGRTQRMWFSPKCENLQMTLF